MQFQVPQFIEVEDKIFGPFTLKQFIYMAGGAAVIFLILRFLPLLIGIPVSLPVLGFTLALAFYKPNERQSFVVLLESAFMYAVKSRLYIWKKQEKKPVPGARGVEKEADSLLYVPKLADSKLKDMTWTLDVSEALNPVTGGPRDRNIPQNQ